MDYANIFQLISGITKKAEISCILIGGFAVNYYKVTRQTLDVDFLITKEGQEAFARLKNNKLGLFDNDDFRQLCLKYGTEELYEKIITSLRK